MAQVRPARSTPLDEQLCFALYTASRAMTSCYRPLLDALDLTYPQYLVLLVLWEQDGLTVTALGERLHLDSGTLSPLLRRLEAHGFIVRERADVDSRRLIVSLTDAGDALRERAADVQRCLLQAVALAPEDLLALRDLSRRFVTAGA